MKLKVDGKRLVFNMYALQELISRALGLVLHIVHKHTYILKDRHLDQILMSAIYTGLISALCTLAISICLTCLFFKLASAVSATVPKLTFSAIIRKYKDLPQVSPVG